MCVCLALGSSAVWPSGCLLVRLPNLRVFASATQCNLRVGVLHLLSLSFPSSPLPPRPLLLRPPLAHADSSTSTGRYFSAGAALQPGGMRSDSVPGKEEASPSQKYVDMLIDFPKLSICVLQGESALNALIILARRPAA